MGDLLGIVVENLMILLEIAQGYNELAVGIVVLFSGVLSEPEFM